MKKILYCLMAFLMIIGCQNNESENVAPELSLERYAEFKAQLTASYNHISETLRKSNASFKDVEKVKAIAADYYGSNSDRYKSFIASYETKFAAANGRSTSTSSLTPVQESKMLEIVAQIGVSASADDFVAYLGNQFNEVYYAPTMDVTDKDVLLTYITAYEASIEFLMVNSDVINAEMPNEDEPCDTCPQEPDWGRTQGWWDSWGKCAAGILGGAISTGGAGVLAGAAVGTVALPVVGTVSGAVVGGIAGAIGGGLTGAATFC